MVVVVQVLDTAGVDDVGELGGKKRAKALQALKEARAGGGRAAEGG